MKLTAGHLLRAARVRAGMTQTELASRARVSQSVVSTYEAGAREPSFATLGKLISATGLRLDVQLAPDEKRSELRERVDFHRAEIVALFARLGGRNVRLFGSVARSEDVAESDIDLVVDLDEGVGILALAQMRREAEQILGNRVDVIPSVGLKREVAATLGRESVAL